MARNVTFALLVVDVLPTVRGVVGSAVVVVAVVVVPPSHDPINSNIAS